MNFESNERKQLDKNRLPDSVYKSVVKSLYADPQSLMLGMLCMIAAPVVLFWKTGDPFQLGFSFLFTMFGLMRLALTNQFDKVVTIDDPVDVYAKWEKRYVLASAAYVTLLGLWFFIGFARTNDPFVQLMSFSLALCYLIGIIGRNFGSDEVVRVQVVAAGFLLISAFLLFGNGYHAVLAGFLFPFFMAIWTMSTRVRNMLFEAELTARENRTIADRFDIALDNIAHGIAMFKDNGTIVVANDRFVRLAGLGDQSVIGSRLSALEGAKLKVTNEKPLVEKIHDCLKMRQVQRFSFELESNQTIEADFYPVPTGGVLLLADISERVASEKAIRKLASFDPLTNLPNRRFFMAEVDRRVTTDGVLNPCAMFFLDLDKFKEVNDTMGHAVGDKLLRSTASRLRLILPENGMICRFGGDEFVIVVPDMSDEADCRDFAETVIQEITLPVLIENNHFNTGASIGISIAPKNGADADELLQHADAALYDAKARGRSTYSFYTDELGEKIKIRRELETDLRKALEADELELHYQPLVNLKASRITTCEALLRWRHPVHGQVSPGVFIQIAEETGMITRLGEYVLRKAATECLSWPDNVRVAVNVSSLQFQQSDVSAVVKKVLEETGLDPQRLEIEVTESATLESVEETIKTLNSLSNAGVRISLDDFGTGFSSLSYLHSLPLDKVKIDRSFIQDVLEQERSLTLLRGVIDLTKKLKLSVVLEGIETEEQMSLLSSGSVIVDEVQGFLFSRPLPVRDIRILLGQPERAFERDDQETKLTG